LFKSKDSRKGGLFLQESCIKERDKKKRSGKKLKEAKRSVMDPVLSDYLESLFPFSFPSKITKEEEID